MIYAKWIFLSLLNFIFMFICYLTNFIVVAFADKDGELPRPFKLWQTWDDSCNPPDVVRDKEIPSIFLYDWQAHYEQIKGATPKLSEVNRERYFSICFNNDFTIWERVQRYICRAYWLTRNCGYGFAFWWFGANVVPADIVYTKRTADLIICHYGNYWKYADSREICTIFGRRLEWNNYLGWKLPDSAETKVTRCMIAMRIAFKIRKIG